MGRRTRPVAAGSETEADLAAPVQLGGAMGQPDGAGSAGRTLGTPDLIDERLGMAAEYDGAEHRRRGRHRRDVRRLDDFQRAGLEIATFVGEDLDDERLVADRLRATAQRAGRLPRRWRLADPGPTLDERLDHRDHLIAMAEGTDF